MLRSIKYGLHGAVLAGLIAAPVLWTSVDKSVHLVVDGKQTTVHTTAGSVGDVLAANDLHVTGHDLLAPRAGAKVHDGMHVVVRRGRLLVLDIDGTRKQIWTTAPTVERALGQLGYSTSDFVSVSRSRRLPLQPTSIAIRTPKLVTLVHDGRRDLVSTTDATVRAMLDDVGVHPDANDTLSAAPAAEVTQGQTITLRRVGKKTVTRTEKIDYRTSHENDSTLEKGTTRLVRAGRDGKARVTYSVTYVDGTAVHRKKVKTVTLAKSRTKVIGVGTKRTVVQASGGAPVPHAAKPDPGTAKDIARQLLPKFGFTGPNQYDCLVQMWNHESGWRVNAANPSGAYGIPQALPGSKMSSAGPDWQTSAKTQIKWGLGYIEARYGTPCGAWGFWQNHNYY